MNIYFLIIIFVHIEFVQMILNIPVGKIICLSFFFLLKFKLWIILGLLFNGNDRDIYKRLNPLARQYVLNKLERRFQYNVTELIDTFNFDNTDIDTWSRLCTQLSDGTMSIIGHVDEDNYEWLSGFCSAYQVPFLGLDIHDHIKNNYYISLMPDILPGLIALIRRYGITQLIYLYDDI